MRQRQYWWQIFLHRTLLWGLMQLLNVLSTRTDIWNTHNFDWLIRLPWFATFVARLNSLFPSSSSSLRPNDLAYPKQGNYTSLVLKQSIPVWSAAVSCSPSVYRLGRVGLGLGRRASWAVHWVGAWVVVQVMWEKCMDLSAYLANFDLQYHW